MFIDEKSLDDLKRNFQNSHASVMITNKNSVIEYVNSQFEKRTGYDSSEVIGKKASILKSNDTSSEKYTNLWQTILRGKIWSGEFKN
ncbi:MAG: PAS domain S-box protein [Melioribacteraceae bacterium]|nr:PAS domain S-box protein [Melioribacteraceae bacterium]